MTVLNPLIVQAFDPNCAISTPARPVTVIVKSRAVTLDADFDEYGRFILVDVTGPVSYVGWDGVTVVIPVLSSGVYHPICAKRINSSGTTATNCMWGN